MTETVKLRMTEIDKLKMTGTVKLRITTTSQPEDDNNSITPSLSA